MEFVDLVERLHTHASSEGRGVGASIAELEYQAITFEDRMFGAAMTVAQAPYIAKFRRAIETGQYGDLGSLFDPRRAMSRVELYGRRAIGSANEQMLLMFEEEPEIWWRLGPNENHCHQCPEIAAGGPYSRATLPGVPGAARTDCGPLCKCHLEVNGVEVTMFLGDD